MPPKPKGKVATLARVRNNQRRCRARKREYVAELERKLQECGENARLENENRKLRELLEWAGVENDRVERYLSTEGEMGEVSGTGGFEERGPREILTNLAPTRDTANLPTSSDDLLAESFLQFPGEEANIFDFLRTTSPLNLSPIPENFLGPSVPSTCCDLSSALSSDPLDAQPLTSDEPYPGTTSDDDSETTLCSVAFKLVSQHNKKGIDMVEIGIRLWNGFVKGDEVGGCRVENKLLFGVLEYISG